MDKRTITIDAGDIKGGFDIAEKVFKDIAGDKIDIRNLDAFFDSVTESGNGLRIVVKNAERLTPDARRMLDDALANSTGLEIVFKNSNGSSKCRASTPMVDIRFRSCGEKPKEKTWWDVFYSRLVKIFLWMLAVGLPAAIIFLLAKRP